MSSNVASLDIPVEGSDEQLSSRQHITGFGFYIYLLSDGILFAALFAVFAVLRTATDGGPDGHMLFSAHNAFIETACLLTSSFTCGIAMLACDRRNKFVALIGFLVTAALGLTFLALEVHEFADLISRGDGPDRSAFLSSFFTLVSTHGLHVTCGLLWLGVLLVQFLGRGFTPAMVRRFLCFSLFWHVLDVVWIGVFTFVYLVGGYL
ncbi:cytochrome o ubiquinol oxidase subunit III [Rhodanobacter glycinis]|uniref:cytochrome c oxidase subunit 3 n=1 Tax=Rhodanobacter glycinis TaxID=582702 RepID=UPI00112AFC7A|nr:cytochrome c oxidase subunit 3 [Rhodanobacter glycinis]TPG50740.1 cytochrome o ubiquinol oxidase subunit III [Rhodanobacter glycinis]